MKHWKNMAALLGGAALVAAAHGQTQGAVGGAERVKACTFDSEDADSARASLDLLKLANSTDAQVRLCVRNRMFNLFQTRRTPGAEELRRYIAIIKADLASADPATVANAVEAIRHTGLHPSVVLSPAQRQVGQALVEPMVDALLAARAPETAELGFFLRVVADRAQRHVPALFKAAATPSRGADNALVALVELLPNDARVHRLLQEKAANPARRGNAALEYARITGYAEHAVAFSLLIEDGSVAALAQLASYGAEARGVIPQLIASMRGAPDIKVRSAALVALVTVSNGEAVVLEAIGAALTAGPDRALDDESVGKLSGLQGHGRGLLPAFEIVMTRPMTQARKDGIGEAILYMGLPEEQSAPLRARLDRVVVQDDGM